jgi:predicted transcriptional regulator
MKISEIVQITEAKLITGEASLEGEVVRAFASDLMSDVLTLDTDNLLLITGLINLQTIRTAEMAEIRNILIVRNKKPSEEMIALAKKENILLMVSDKSMFHASGLLFKAGLKPVF